MFDVIIIGGGPAGLTAAIYGGRRSLKTLVLTRDIGGQTAKTFDIENYPGILHTTGPDLAQTMMKQAQNFGVEIKYEEVKKIEPGENIISLIANTTEYKTKTVILAFGKQPRELDVPGEEKFKGKGVSYCATCDMPFFRNKTVAVVGGGNSALDAALLASGMCKQVYLIHRRKEFLAEQVLTDKVKKAKNVELVLEANIKEIKGENTVTSIVLDNDREIKIDGVVIEVGYIIDRTLIEKLVKLNPQNQVVISANQETSVPGIFAAGDLTTTPYKQIVISAGEGAKAALSAYDYIQRIEGKRGITGDWGKK